MIRAQSADEILASPIGRYLAGSFYVVWVHSPTLLGTVYFGRPDENDFAPLEPLFSLPSHRALQTPYDVLVDAGDLEALPPNAFEFLTRYLEVATTAAPRMRRVSIVRPHGHAGIMLAGVFYELVRDRFRAALFADRAEASAWLGHADSAAVCAELDAIVDDLRHAPVELRRLRDHLQANLAHPALDRAASELGLPTRSLQRVLRRANTSFRHQVEHARVRAAEGLLSDGDLKLEVIARMVGYSTLSHFSVAFRRATGEAPSDFRRRRRSA